MAASPATTPLSHQHSRVTAAAVHQGYISPSPRGTEGYTSPSPRGTEGYTSQSTRSTEGYTSQSTRGTEGYTSHSTRGTEGYTSQSTRSTEGYTSPSPRGTEGYTSQSTRGRAGYTSPSPRGTAGYTSPSPRGTEEYTSPSPRGTAGYTNPSPRGTAGYTNSSPRGRMESSVSSISEEFDEQQNMEPDLENTSHMNFVDGRCTCCPYGYHIDLDFLRFLEGRDKGVVLRNLKKIHGDKKKLRKSFEVFLQAQERANEGDSSGPPPDVVHSTESFMNMVEDEQNSATNEILEELDSSVNATLSSIDLLMHASKNKSSKVSSSSLSDEVDMSYRAGSHRQQYREYSQEQRDARYRTEAELMLNQPRHLGANDKSDSVSSLSSQSTYSGDISPSVNSSYNSSQHATTTVSQSTVLTSSQLASNMASLLPEDGYTISISSSDMTTISASTLQAIRQQMAISLQRMRELEEQVKAIPVLQVRISVLKEEKRLLALQLKAKSSKMNVRTIGSSDARLDDHIEPYSPTGKFHTETQINLSSLRQQLVGEAARAKPATRTIGVGDENVFEYDRQLQLAAGAGAMVGTRYHEKEFHKEQTTEVHEKEVKTVFLGQSSDETDQLRMVQQYRQERPPKPERPARHTRSIGVGESDVHDDNVHVHEREFRTVYIGEEGKEKKPTRNVGILCKAAMRDVGVMYMYENEKPPSRSIAVGVGEMGVGEGGFFGDMAVAQMGEAGEGGGGGGGLMSSSSTTTHNTMQQMNLAAFYSRHIHIKPEQLTIILDKMLKRSVHSVGVQCRFATVDRGVGHTSSDLVNKNSIGCGSDSVDVEVRPVVQTRSVAVENRPALMNRLIGTESKYNLDASTNTSSQMIHIDRAVNTNPIVTYPAAVNTDRVVHHTMATETDLKIFQALDQVKNAAVNTTRKAHATIGTNTEPTKVLQEQNFDFAITFADKNVNTEKVTRKNIHERGTNTEPVRFSTRGINTVPAKVSERGVMTSKPYTPSTGVNTDIVRMSSVGVGDSAARVDKSSTGTSAGGLQDTSFRSVGSGSASVDEQYLTMSEVQVLIRKNVTQLERQHEMTLKQQRSELQAKLQQHVTLLEQQRQEHQNVLHKQTREHQTAIQQQEQYQLVLQEQMQQQQYMHQTQQQQQQQQQHATKKTSHTVSVGVGDNSVHEELLTMSEVQTLLEERMLEEQQQQQQQQLQQEEEGLEQRREVQTVSVQMGDHRPTEATTTTTTSEHGAVSSSEMQRMMMEQQMMQHMTGTRENDEADHRTSGGSQMRVVRNIETAYVGGHPVNRSSNVIVRGQEGSEVEHATSAGSSPAVSSSTESSESKTVGGRTVTTKTTTRTSRRHVGDLGIRGITGIDLLDNQNLLQMQQEANNNLTRTESSSGSGDDGRTVEYTHQTEPASKGRRTVITETRVERNVTGEPGSGGVTETTTTTSSSGGSLKSIMKHQKGMELADKGKKEITFSEDVVGGYRSSSDDEHDEERDEDGDGAGDGETKEHAAAEEGGAGSGSDSEGSQSSMSYDEGSYDGRLGKIVYTCRDDEAVTEGSEGANMYDDQNIRETFELGQDTHAACEIYSQWLEDSTQITTKQLNAATNTLQQEWFKTSSHKLSNPTMVEDFLTCLNEISHDLFTNVVNFSDTNGNTALHYAVSHCNMEVVNLLLDTEQCDVNKQNKAGYTAIMLASLAQIQTDHHRTIIRRMFNMGDVNSKASQAGQTALMLAVSHGREDMVRMLLEGGADVNDQDEDGSTALMCASEHGHTGIVKLLLAHPDCDPTITDNDGSTALSIAMEAGHRDIGVLLYAHVNFRQASPVLGKKFKWRSSSTSPTSPHSAFPPLKR